MGLLAPIQNLIDRFRSPSPDITKYTASSMDIKGASSRIGYVLSEFEKALVFEQTNREWEESNWSMYSGFDYGQWDDEAVAVLQGEGRHVPQFNFVRGKIDGLGGAIFRNWYDLDFVPVDEPYGEATRVLEELFLIDKELMDWGQHYLQAIIDGLVYRGILQMKIDDKYNPLGNISLERIMPGHVVPDPHWLTESSCDLKRLWKLAYMTPKEIMHKYKHQSERIKELVELMANIGDAFDNGEDAGYPHMNADSIYGRKYRVIEQHHIEVEDKEVEVDVKSGMVIPPGTDEEKREWCIMHNIECTEGVINYKYPIDVYYVTTICPELDSEIMLEDRKAEIQIGRLPFYIWSAARINGRCSGLVDLLYDVQQTINKRESLLDHIIATSAVGNVVTDPELFGEDLTMMEEFKRNWNKPGSRMFSKAGEITSGRKHFEEVPRPTSFPEVTNEINRMIDYTDRLSKQPPSMDARNESSHETGILFARKQLQSEIVQATVLERVKQLWNEIGEGYLLVAPQLYGRSYRKVTSANGKDVIEINKIISTQEGLTIQNDITKLPRHKVIVSQSTMGATVRATDRAIASELMTKLSDANMASKAKLTKKILSTVDFSDEDKAELKETGDLEYTLAKEMIKTQIKGLQMKQIQMDMALQGTQGGEQGVQAMAPQQPGRQQAPQGAQVAPGEQEIPLQ